MKAIKLALFGITAVALLSISAVRAADDKKPCCEATVEAGKKCAMKCCTTAAEKDKVCKKCHPKPATK